MPFGINTFKKYRVMLKNWNLMRVVRLAFGIYIIIQGLELNQWLFVGLGVLFSLMPLLNIGYCSTGNCSTGNCEVPTQKIGRDRR